MLKKVKYPIALKLVTIVSLLAVVILGAMTVLATYFIRLDVQLTAEENNHVTNRQTATIAEYELNSLRDNTVVFMTALSVLGFDDESVPYFASLFYETNTDVAAMLIPGVIEFINEDFFTSNGVEKNSYYTYLEGSKDLLERAEKGELLFDNATLEFGVPAITMMLPWTGGEEPGALVSILSVEPLTETFGSNATHTSFMINDKNEILIHPDFDIMYSGVNMTNASLVDQMRQNNDENRQIVFEDTQGTEFFGAYTKLPLGDIGVFTIIESSLIFESVNTTLYQNVLLAIAVLSLAIIFIRFFANSIAKPILVLTDASEQIEQGNFSLDLKAHSKDEVGLLTHRFMSMCKGLETFGRFVNLDIARKAMAGTLELGGESKTVTIFFSDIRAFTEISEKLDPSEVILFLNEYMTRMVGCVNETNGAVDKFIGDAVMAVWGASTTTGAIESDAIAAVRTSLMMRAALQRYNILRKEANQPVLRVGCGLNSGDVVAGQIGSLERMEYTVIGDAVNLASRTEMLTKLFCTDILITEATYELVKDYVLVEKMPSVSVKGKEKPVQIYAVINMPDEVEIEGVGKEGPQSLDELRVMLGFPKPDLSTVDVNAEERKYNLER